MITVKQLGIGTGAGQPVEIIRRDEIERVIDELNPDDVFHAADCGWIPGAKTGLAVLDLRTGELGFASFSTGEQDQACDSVYVVLYTLDQNSEIPADGECGCEEHPDCGCEVLLNSDRFPYNWQDVMPEWRGSRTESIQWQLDEWYSDGNMK